MGDHIFIGGSSRGESLNNGLLIDGRPARTSVVPLAREVIGYAYGDLDEADGISFEEGLRKAGVPVKEGAQLPPHLRWVSVDTLEERALLEGDSREPAPPHVSTMEYLSSSSSSRRRYPKS